MSLWTRSQDDKGPGIAALYAVSIDGSRLSLNQRIRFIYGTDEEIL